MPYCNYICLTIYLCKYGVDACTRMYVCAHVRLRPPAELNGHHVVKVRGKTIKRMIKACILIGIIFF